ncbi:MAG: type II CAAX endopeptidase family protein [Candidatus Bathyarchaeia archaeon]
MAVEVEEAQKISPSEAILLVIASFFLLLFAGSFVDWVGYGVTMMLGEVLLAVLPLIVMILRRINVKNYIGLRLKFRDILLGVVIGIFLLFFEGIVNSALISVFGESKAIKQSNQIMVELSRTTDGLILAIATLTLAGICEEFVFRGFLQTTITKKYSAWVSVVVSSLAFGLFHFDLQVVYTLSAFLMGLVLSFIYHHWHSYSVCATAHASLNLIVFIIVTMVPS